ncbi:MAG TPA: hypothetical protein VF064_16625 [Pyrinomonadaceae bacterium]
MAETSLPKWTGMAGVATFALILATVPFYFVYSGPPPARNVLARSLVGMFSLVALLGFVVGLQALARRARPGEEAPATLLGSLGVILVAVDFVAIAQEAGAVLGRTDPFDPTLVGSGAEGALVIYGPVGRILTAALLAAAGAVTVRARLLPAGVGWAAFALGAVQLAFVATYFSGTDPAQFFSVNGWHLPVLGSLLGLWILSASVALLRRN